MAVHPVTERTSREITAGNLRSRRVTQALYLSSRASTKDIVNRVICRDEPDGRIYTYSRLAKCSKRNMFSLGKWQN